MAANKPQSEREPGPRSAKRTASNARLLGKVAVVTGGSRGIGYAIARTLAAEGCSIVITGRDDSTLSKSAAQLNEPHEPPTIVPIVCDVRDEKSVGALFAEVERRFGKIDVLVNNAGITQRVVTVEETTLEMWRDVLDTNLTGTFLC